MTDQPRLLDTAPAGEEMAEEERARYRVRLREKLLDPAFRATEGFPKGEDEAILAMSDPPYYTACPNPFLPEIVARWREERRISRERLGLPDDSADGNGGEPVYRREPFATDVSEGKNDPIYNAHSYHTKVPHRAIMRYILHYTDPGDLVFDGFAGTGMAGVAAQLCGDRRAVEALGYRVDAEGVIFDGKRSLSRLGARMAALVDLSPAATFIAHNYNSPVDAEAFQWEAKRILAEVEAELGWMYETWHPHCDAPDRVKGRISYTIWSELFICPSCGGEVTFLKEALDRETLRVREQFPCPHCGAAVNKDGLERQLATTTDLLLGTAIRTLRLRPMAIEYTVDGAKHTKEPDAIDLATIERIGFLRQSDWFPTDPLPISSMYHGSRLAPKGVTHLHHLFLPRARHCLAALWRRATALEDRRLRSFLLFTVEQAIWGMSLLNRYGPTHYSQVNRYLSGVYYISSLISEVSPWYILEGKTRRLVSAFAGLGSSPGGAVVSTQSAAVPPPVEECADYIFTDPPFGENIYYADLNYLVESWHGVTTDSGPEAIVDQAKHKTLRDYQELMRRCFAAYYRWLKPGRWMTVEFHNSHNAVWNAIQEALLAAGFVVADVRTLDKQQPSYRQVTAASAAKQDLVISAYKPRSGFEKRFLQQAGTPEGAWEFVRQHLAQLPVAVPGVAGLEAVAERQPYLLFDRMVAFHIQRGATVPLSAAEFYAGLRERFPERDGMFFLADQTPEYDGALLEAGRVEQLTLLVTDEKSTIQWLRQQLDPALGGKPQRYQEILPLFLQQIHQARHEALPELLELLDQNFLQDSSGRWFAPDPGNAEHLERIRKRALLADFAVYAAGRGRLRQFRTEAVRAGFADAYARRDYRTIVVVAERLPELVLQEDPDLLMYYDNASLRTGQGD